MSASYLEGNYDQEDDNAISLSAIKKRYKQETSKRMCSYFLDGFSTEQK